MRPKASATRELVIERAYGLARTVGLEGLTISRIADAAGLSKSGIFAHFKSRADLQLAVLDSAAGRFFNTVMPPAIALEAGLPRIRRIMEGWFECMRDTGPGCVLAAAASEYDDRGGPQRDRLMTFQMRWRLELEKAACIAMSVGDFPPDTDPAQVAYELHGLALALHHHAATDGYAPARRRADVALARFLQCQKNGCR